MSSFFLFQVSCISALIVFVWFNTDFLVQYLKLLKPVIPKNIFNFFLVDAWSSGRTDGIDEYPEYLLVKHINCKNKLICFFLKLISCKICFSVWVSLILSLVFLDLMYVGVVFCLTITVDFFINFILIKVNKYLQ